MTNVNKAEEQSSASKCVPSYDTSDPLQKEVSRILKSFKYDILGIIHIGNDGVLRSLTADRRVISAEGLRPELVETFHSRFPADYIKQITTTDYADGTKTPSEKWFAPDEGALPAPLSQEAIDQVKNSTEEHKELLRKRMRDDPSVVDVDGVLASPAATEMPKASVTD